MKRSKIFLGITTCMLAIAGVAAANHFRGSITRWYITAGVGFPVTKHCVPSGSITCVYDNGKLTTCLYQNLAVFTSGTTGPKENCKNKFVFTQNL